MLSGERLVASLLRGNWLYWPSLAFRRATMAGHRFHTRSAILLDLSIILDMLLDGARLLVVPEHAFAYRRHRASASSVALLEGPRFADERELYALTAARLQSLGWRQALRAARWHPTSRLHAATLLPRALLARDSAGTSMLLRHTLGGWSRL